MAVSYFMGSRSGEAKKSGNWFGCISLLHLNAWNQWSIDPYWVLDKNTYDVITDGLSVGCAVALTLDTEMKVTDLHVFDDVQPLLLPSPAD